MLQGHQITAGDSWKASLPHFHETIAADPALRRRAYLHALHPDFKISGALFELSPEGSFHPAAVHFLFMF